MKFDLHLSRNFIGDPYHWPMDAESAGEVRWWIQDFWEFSQLTTPDTEAILFAEIGTANLKKLAVISYDSSGLLSCLMSMEDLEAISVLASLGYMNGALVKGNKSFEKLIDSLFSIQPREY